MPSVILTTGWQYGSFAVLLILARLQSINPRLYEAARTCGAGSWRCFVDVAEIFCDRLPECFRQVLPRV